MSHPNPRNDKYTKHYSVTQLLSYSVAIIVALVLTVSCEKDSLLDVQPVPNSQVQYEVANSPSILKAKSTFEQKKLAFSSAKSTGEQKSLTEATPIWNQARTTVFGEEELLLVPYWFIENVVPSSAENVYLVFYDNEQGDQQFKGLGYEPFEEGSSNGKSGFTGYFFMIEHNLVVSQVQELNGGSVVRTAYDPDGDYGEYMANKANLDGSSFNKNACAESAFVLPPWLASLLGIHQVRCPKPRSTRNNNGPRSRWSNFFAAIGNFFGETNGSTYTPSGVSVSAFYAIYGSITTTRGVRSNNTDFGGGGGGGGGTDNSIDPGFGTNFFTVTNFWDQLAEHSAVVQDIASLSLEYGGDNDEVRDFIDLLPILLSSCLNDYADLSIEDNFTAQYVCVLDHAMNFPAVENNPPLKNALRSRMLQILTGSDISILDYLIEHPETTNMISDFLQENNLDESSKEYVAIFFNMVDEDSNYKWERFEELFGLLKNNPDALFEDCADEIEPWADLASFVPSGDALDKLERLDQYVLQTIQNADSKLINLDRFAIKIDVLPSKAPGVRFTPSEFFDFIRKNLTTFAPKFVFEDDHADVERNLWLSDDPYTAILNIRLLDGGIGNVADGDVMCTQYSECCWIFSTIRGLFYESGDHPVSGNRQFGYNFDETSGEFEFYVQGADRVTRPWHSLLFLENQLYDEGADFWNDLMQEVKEFTLSSGGNVSEISEPISIRPSWNEIKDKLISDEPLTIVPCGN